MLVSKITYKPIGNEIRNRPKSIESNAVNGIPRNCNILVELSNLV
jgi:hypothetical protein